MAYLLQGSLLNVGMEPGITLIVVHSELTLSDDHA
jgi:hypothetical protein